MMVYDGEREASIISTCVIDNTGTCQRTKSNLLNYSPLTVGVQCCICVTYFEFASVAWKDTIREKITAVRFVIEMPTAIQAEISGTILFEALSHEQSKQSSVALFVRRVV